MFYKKDGLDVFAFLYNFFISITSCCFFYHASYLINGAVTRTEQIMIDMVEFKKFICAYTFVVVSQLLLCVAYIVNGGEH